MGFLRRIRRMSSFVIDDHDLDELNRSFPSSTREVLQDSSAISHQTDGGEYKYPAAIPSSPPSTPSRGRDLSAPDTNPFLKKPKLEVTRVEYPKVEPIQPPAKKAVKLEKPEPKGSKTLKLDNAQIELMTQRPPPAQLMDSQVQSQDDQKEKIKVVQAITLSAEQSHIIELARQGTSLFYTGSAGTGKSLLLRSLIKALKSQHSSASVAVTASTGLAACNIGGQTLHSFAGIGLGQGSVQDLVKKIKRSKKHLDRWRQTKVLVIDEISMINGELLDKLNGIAKKLRKNNRPFGGIQLIICGDFFQLPPVSRDGNLMFAFECEAWMECISCTIILKKVFRQQGDTDFVDMLNEIRLGKVSDKTHIKFLSLSRELNSDNGIVAAELYPTKREVETANRRRLEAISRPSVFYKALDSGMIADEVQRKKMLESLMVPELLELKVGAQVMLVKNMDQTLVNGSLGKIIAFADKTTYEVSQMIDSHSTQEIEKVIDESLAERHRKVLKLKSSTSPPPEGSVFDFLGDLVKTRGIDPEVRADLDRKLELIQSLESQTSDAKLPLVRFIQPDGTTREVLVHSEDFKITDEHDHVIVQRTQLPLILAWSLSIHKAQGQTLSKVKIDLRRAFEKGQAYVALSRATHRTGLQVLNFRPEKVMAHPKVMTFYEGLVDIDQAIEQLNERKAKMELQQSEDSDCEQLDENYDGCQFEPKVRTVDVS